MSELIAYSHDEIEEKMTDEMTAVGMGDDGNVHIVFTPAAIVLTFTMLSADHIDLSCPFIDSLAYVVTHDEEVKKLADTLGPVIPLMIKDVQKRHNVEEFVTGLVYKAGEGEKFAGRYVAKILPLELAAIGTVFLERSADLPTSLRDSAIGDVVKMWVRATANFTEARDHMALASTGGNA